MNERAGSELRESVRFEMEAARRQEEFFGTLAAAPASLLMVDYDGTLAPFRTERMKAVPYAGVLERLAAIQSTPGSGFVVVSGRSAAEVARLMEPLTGFAIYGAHGLEVMEVDGHLERPALDERDVRALKSARGQLEDLGMAAALEEKSGGLALHWRDEEPHAAERMRALALRQWTPLLAGSSLRILPFDGGLELRVTKPDKGDAVRTILAGLPSGGRAAYLGDDVTDEDAFRAMGESGVGVLVREEWRATAARLWLRPPEQLLDFLDRWIAAAAEKQTGQR